MVKKCQLSTLSTSSILKCKYSMNKSELKVYEAILKSKKDITMKELIDRIGKDRTTLQRTLNNLLDKNIISKKQVNLHKGFMYTYYVENKVKLLEDIKKNIEETFLKITLDIEKITA